MAFAGEVAAVLDVDPVVEKAEVFEAEIEFLAAVRWLPRRSMRTGEDGKL